VLIALVGVLTIWGFRSSQRKPASPLEITYLGSTIDAIDLFAVTNRTRYTIKRSGQLFPERPTNQGPLELVFPGGLLAPLSGEILKVPQIIPNGETWRLKVKWDYTWSLRHSLRQALPIKLKMRWLPLPEPAKSDWLQRETNRVVAPPK
jgi:hypothetical protein